MSKDINGRPSPESRDRAGLAAAALGDEPRRIDPDTGKELPSVAETLEMAGEEELRRYRKLGPLWTKVFQVVAIVATFLAINQMFNLGLFIDHTIIENQIGRAHDRTPVTNAH